MPDSEYAMDFFVSHADADTQWAEWIAAELEGAGYGVIVKAWDFRPGEDILVRHDQALATCRHTLCVLSAAYVDSEIAARTAAHYQALQGKERALIPVRVADCLVPPSLGPIIAIDLSDVEEDDARHRLRTGVAGRADRVARGGFPKPSRKKIRFPAEPQEVWELRGHRPDPHFSGRDEELAGLHRALRAGRTTSTVQAITGLGGLGKTRLVVEYVYRHAAAYNVVWWVRAEDPTTLRGDLIELAQELGLPAEQDSQAIAALRQELRRRKDWLIVFDNAENPDDLFPLLPDRHSGHVLITAQLREWPHAEILHLGALPAEAAVGYLRRRGQVADADVALSLAEALGCLPLALAQAASVIADGMRASDYLDLLHRQSPELFAAGRSGDHHATIDSTWSVSFDRLSRRSPAAVALFRLAAFLSADAIPLARLTPAPGMPAELAEALTNALQLSQATRALGEYSLAESGDGLLSIHRMVQAVTRTELADDAPKWAGIALSAISAVFPRRVRDPRAWDDCETVLTHVLTCSEHARRLNIDTAATAQLLDRLAGYLLARGRLGRASAALEKALAAVGQLHPDHPAYLACRNTQGLLLLAQGDLPAARVAHEEVYQARMRILGPEHADTLRAGHGLVQALYRQGHWAQAARLQDRLVGAFTAVLGPDDPETITSLGIQATLVSSAGEFTRARAIQEQVLAANCRILGEDHPDTLHARGNLANTLYELGEAGQARELEEQVLAARSRILGDEHPHTLQTRSSLATTLYELGELSEARAIEEQVLAANGRILGEDHPDTLQARGNLAATLRDLGDLSQARETEEQVLAARIRILGEDHPHTLHARGSLAATLAALGELSQARELEEQVLAANGRILGEDHPDTLHARANLAATLRDLGELSQAREMEEQVLAGRSRVLGDDHPYTIHARGSLAATLAEQGELSQARELEEEVLKAFRRVLGEEHRSTVLARVSLAMTLFELEETSEAHSLMVESLMIGLRVFGKKHTLTTKAAWQLAAICSPHEANKQKAIIAQYLSWLTREPPGRLTAEQKDIKEQMKGAQRRQNSKGSASRKKRKK